jgi:hypothetical protein
MEVISVNMRESTAEFSRLRDLQLLLDLDNILPKVPEKAHYFLVTCHHETMKH